MCAVSIAIHRSAAGYSATVTPSPTLPAGWATERPIGREALIDRLVESGYHLQDITDALFFADAEWGRRNE